MNTKKIERLNKVIETINGNYKGIIKTVASKFLEDSGEVLDHLAFKATKELSLNQFNDSINIHPVNCNSFYMWGLTVQLEELCRYFGVRVDITELPYMAKRADLIENFRNLARKQIIIEELNEDTHDAIVKHGHEALEIYLETL